VGGEIEVYAQNEDGKEDVTRPEPVTQGPRALESNASGGLVAHLSCLIIGNTDTYTHMS
jgi:hypothetical protein